MAGSGFWLLGATAALFAAMWGIKLFFDAVARVGNTEGPPVDPRDEELWHRYEEGDLTAAEFDRLRHTRQRTA